MVIITQDAQGHAPSLRPGREHKSHSALEALGPTEVGAQARRTWEEPSNPPVCVVPPRLSSPFLQRPRGQSRCHDTAGQVGGSGCCLGPNPHAQSPGGGERRQRPRPWSSGDRDWQTALSHTPEARRVSSSERTACSTVVSVRALKEDLRPSSPPILGPSESGGGAGGLNSRPPPLPPFPHPPASKLPVLSFHSRFSLDAEWSQSP